MQTEYYANELDHWKLPNGNYIVKRKKDEGLDGADDRKCDLGAFPYIIVKEV